MPAIVEWVNISFIDASAVGVEYKGATGLRDVDAAREEGGVATAREDEAATGGDDRFAS